MLGKGSKDMLHSARDICAKPFPTTTEFTQEAACRYVQAAPAFDLIVGFTASPRKCLWGAHPGGVSSPLGLTASPQGQPLLGNLLKRETYKLPFGTDCVSSSRNVKGLWS